MKAGTIREDKKAPLLEIKNKQIWKYKGCIVYVSMLFCLICQWLEGRSRLIDSDLSPHPEDSGFVTLYWDLPVYAAVPIRHLTLMLGKQPLLTDNIYLQCGAHQMACTHGSKELKRTHTKFRAPELITCFQNIYRAHLGSWEDKASCVQIPRGDNDEAKLMDDNMRRCIPREGMITQSLAQIRLPLHVEDAQNDCLYSESKDY